MGCVIDHLSADLQVTVLQTFADARGVQHVAGENAVIRAITLHGSRQEIEIAWERDGGSESIFFSLAAKSGPRNGHMREFFAAGEHVPLPQEIARQFLGGRPVPMPRLFEEPVTDVTLHAEAVDRVWALAARRRFAEAEAQLQLILAPEDPHDGRLEQVAEAFVAIAMAHAFDRDSTVYDWLRDRAIHLWYAWGSHATGGGEGAVRADRIQSVEERLARCHAGRRDDPRAT